VAKQAAARPAFPGWPAVTDALVHVAVVGPHDMVVIGMAGLEDALAVIVDREPVDAARGKQAQQSGQDGWHVHQIQDGVGDQHVGHVAVTGLQVIAELSVYKAHPQITHLQAIRQQFAVHTPGGRPIAQPSARTIQQRPIRIQQDVLAGADDSPVQQTGHHRPEAGADLQHPRCTRGH